MTSRVRRGASIYSMAALGQTRSQLFQSQWGLQRDAFVPGHLYTLRIRLSPCLNQNHCQILLLLGPEFRPAMKPSPSAIPNQMRTPGTPDQPRGSQLGMVPTCRTAMLPTIVKKVTQPITQGPVHFSQLLCPGLGTGPLISQAVLLEFDVTLFTGRVFRLRRILPHISDCAAPNGG